MKRKKPGGGSYGGRKAAQSPPKPKLDPEQQRMLEALEAMRTDLECPVAFASYNANRCMDYADDAAAMSRIALLARDLYRVHQSAKPVIAINPLLEEFAATMERFAGEMAALGVRFEAFDDHSIEHVHIDPAAIDNEAVMTAMLGPAEDDEDGDDDD